MSADGGGGSSSGSGASATRPQQQQLEGRIAQPALHLSSDEVNYLVFRSVNHFLSGGDGLVDGWIE